MGGAIEVAGLEDLDDVGHRLVGQEHRSEDGGLGLQVVWRKAMSVTGRQTPDVGCARQLPLPLAAPADGAGLAPRPGDGTRVGSMTTVDNPGGLLRCRSRDEIPCHTASDLGFPHVENHVEQCESHV
jgi:hypothetical protein